MLKKMLNRIFSPIVLDLGAQNTVFFDPARNLPVVAPSYISFRINQATNLRKVLSIGREAKDILGKNPKDIVTIKPFNNGAIADYIAGKRYISELLNNFIKRQPLLFKPRIIVNFSHSTTQVEKRAVFSICKEAGFSSVTAVDKIVAAALGTGLLSDSNNARFFINIGAGTSEFGILNLGEIVYVSSIKIASDSFDRAIRDYIKNKYRINIGPLLAEEIKCKIASVGEFEEYMDIYLYQRSPNSTIPEKVKFTGEECAEAIRPLIDEWMLFLEWTINQIPYPALLDVLSAGVTLSGGGALLKGLAKLIESSFNLKVTIAEDPMLCIAKGSLAAYNAQVKAKDGQFNIAPN